MRPPSRRLGPPTARGTPGLRGHAGCPAPPQWPDRYSSRREVGLECLDRYLDRRIGLVAPQFACGEDHCIEPLRVLAGADRGSVGKDVAPAHRLDDAELAAGIAREAGMLRRMDVFGPYCVAYLEARRTRRGPIEMREGHRLRIVECHLAVEPNARPQRAAGGDLVLADQAMRHDAALQTQKPAFVIGGREIGERRQVFERRTPAVDRPEAGSTH